MNKLVIELSGFGVDGGGRNSKSIQSKWRCWPRVHQPCQKTHADGDNALSKTIMLQIYILEAIEQSCWMCTLGRDWSALLRMPLPPLLNHFFLRLFLRFLSLLLAFHIFCACHTARWCSTSCRQSQSDNQFFILQFSVRCSFLDSRRSKAKANTTKEHFNVLSHALPSRFVKFIGVFIYLNITIILLYYSLLFFSNSMYVNNAFVTSNVEMC